MKENFFCHDVHYQANATPASRCNKQCDMCKESEQQTTAMTSIEARRQEIIHHLWNNANPNPRSSPAFHKWIEELIRQDRKELLKEITELVEQQDSLYDAIEVLKSFKIK